LPHWFGATGPWRRLRARCHRGRGYRWNLSFGWWNRYGRRNDCWGAYYRCTKQRSRPDECVGLLAADYQGLHYRWCSHSRPAQAARQEVTLISQCSATKTRVGRMLAPCGGDDEKDERNRIDLGTQFFGRSLAWRDRSSSIVRRLGSF